MSLKDAVYGLAVGDALGVPYEFKSRGTFTASDMIGWGTYNLAPGTWSDDTSMTLATCDSIRELGNIDTGDIKTKFKAWLNGKYAIDGNVFDVGTTVASSLRYGPDETDIRSNGNGSLMRIAPLAYIGAIEDETIGNVSAITHAHEISKNACKAYVRLLQMIQEGEEIESSIEHTGNEYSLDELLDLKNRSEDEIKSGGYVLDTLKAACWCLLTTQSYKDCVLKAVNLGNDSDTTAAVAGALAGELYGSDAIPKQWVETLRGKEIIEACLF